MQGKFPVYQVAVITVRRHEQTSRPVCTAFTLVINFLPRINRILSYYPGSYFRYEACPRQRTKLATCSTEFYHIRVVNLKPFYRKCVEFHVSTDITVNIIWEIDTYSFIYLFPFLSVSQSLSPFSYY